MIDTGVKAPDFIAPAVAGGTATELELFRLVDRHEAVVLCFAPATFVPTCTAAFAAIRDAGWHDRADLAVVALTGDDSLYAGFAYADQFDLPFPIVSDFHGGIAESYDLLADSWEGLGHSAPGGRRHRWRLDGAVRRGDDGRARPPGALARPERDRGASRDRGRRRPPARELRRTVVISLTSF